MKKSTLKSAPLLCGALLASICAVTETADAVPTTMTLSAWGHTGTAAGQLSLMTGPHVFAGGPQSYVSPFGTTYFITVTSGPGSNRINPDTGLPWQFEMVIDFLPFGITFAPGDRETVELLGIKPAGVPDLVSDFNVKRSDGTNYTLAGGQVGLPSGIINGGTGIRFTLNQIDIQNAPGDIVIIQWDQTIIPAPGAMALLGMAGVVGARGRRRRLN